VVVVERQAARVVPALARYHRVVLTAAVFAGEGGYLCGGTSPERHNVTWNLVASLSGGVDLPRLEVSRLRATWLTTVADALGLPAIVDAAGISLTLEALLLTGGRPRQLAVRTLLVGRLLAAADDRPPPGPGP
jgi:hypothetical protein